MVSHFLYHLQLIVKVVFYRMNHQLFGITYFLYYLEVPTPKRHFIVFTTKETLFNAIVPSHLCTQSKDIAQLVCCVPMHEFHKDVAQVVD